MWDLRNQSLDEEDMDTAIRRALLPHVKGVNVSIRSNIPRSFLSDNVTHEILRIIRELVITVPVVKEHVNVLFSKIGAANRTEAVAIALRKNLLTSTGSC